MKKVIISAVGVVVLATAVFILASGKNQDNQTSTKSQPSPSGNIRNDQTPISVNKVSIENFAFTPAHISVKKGTTVTWTNNDSVAHTVSGDTDDGPNSLTLDPGDTYSFTFNDNGTMGYHCNIHQSMHGTVTVTEN